MSRPPSSIFFSFPLTPPPGHFPPFSFSPFLPSRSAVSHLIISLTITPVLSSFWFLTLFLLPLFLYSPPEYFLKCVTYLMFLYCSPVLSFPEWYVLFPDCYHWSSSACPVSGCRGWLLLKTDHLFLSHVQTLFCVQVFLRSFLFVQYRLSAPDFWFCLTAIWVIIETFNLPLHLGPLSLHTHHDNICLIIQNI